MNILITICARGGSKGIPGKNIKPINGIPLIGYSIKTALQFSEKVSKADIALSTDSAEIKQVASRFGLNTDYVRPAILSSDTAGKIGAIVDIKNNRETITNKKYDYVIDLDVTSPMRSVADIESSLNMMKDNKDAYNLFSVSPAQRNPYFNMVEKKGQSGYYNVVKDLGSSLTHRQAAPVVYDMNASFYIYSNEFFQMNLNSAITDKSLVYVVPHLCFDVDHPIDFEFMEFLIMNNKLDFKIDE
ncbi:acylneuraminate cytidylyltransferase family protein [Saprospiraceae bacterium]|nr:acylneuraminate cytidylyltransferase family protein [Saprospiraceae bacterium]